MKLIFSILVVMVSAVITSYGQFLEEKSPEVYCTDAGAIGGYDPVAFFTEQKAVPGLPEIKHSWNNAEWHFASQENLDAFKSDPEKYAPQFGGYCVYGTASGHKATTIPETWAIIDNKLYFNYNLQVQKLFNKNQKGLIQQANKNWPTVKTQ